MHFNQTKKRKTINDAAIPHQNRRCDQSTGTTRCYIDHTCCWAVCDALHGYHQCFQTLPTGDIGRTQTLPESPLQFDSRTSTKGNRERLQLCGIAESLDESQGRCIKVKDQGNGESLLVHHSLLPDREVVVCERL